MMMELLAQVALPTNMVSLIGSLGIAGAVVVVVFAFLQYLRDDRKTNAVLYESLAQDNREIHSQLKGEIARMGERFEGANELFHEQFRRIAETQTRNIETTVAIVDGLQAAVADMKQSMADIHIMLVQVLPSNIAAAPRPVEKAIQKTIGGHDAP